MNTPSKPITLRAEEVRELQQGAVTIRRKVKPQPPSKEYTVFSLEDWEAETCSSGIQTVKFSPPFEVADRWQWWPLGYKKIPPPFGPPGTVLWVRETWQVPQCWNLFKAPKITNHNFVYYLASDNKDYESRVRPSITMPRWASRLSLEITAQTVEQVDGIWFWVVEGRKV